MKATGIVRRVDALGRLVLPVELRREMSLDPGSPVEVFVEGSRIVLHKYEPACVFCGEADGVLTFLDKRICRACRSALGQRAQLAGVAR